MKESNEELRKMLILAWLAGFATSGEGGNGEYPHELPEHPLKGEVDGDLLKDAEAYAAMIVEG